MFVLQKFKNFKKISILTFFAKMVTNITSFFKYFCIQCHQLPNDIFTFFPTYHSDPDSDVWGNMAPTRDEDCDDKKRGICGKNAVKKALSCIKCKVTYHFSFLALKI